MAQDSAARSSEQRTIEAEKYRSPYEVWKSEEGLETVGGFAVPDLLAVELSPWKSRGGSGVFINLEGTGGFNDTYLYELAPGESSEPIRHIYEETVYILKGHGSTDFSIDQKKWQTLEWHERSYFSIPPNAWHRFHNGSGQESMRYVAMTAAPRVIDTFKSREFVFENPFVFSDRYNGESGYFDQTDFPTDSHAWDTNFVADVMATTPKPGAITGEGRGAGHSSIAYRMVNSTVRSHSRSWPAGTYARFHRHGPGIHVLLLQGHGYSLIWPEGSERTRIDWGPNSMFVPPEGWWHAHFNTDPDPAYFLAIGWGSDKPKLGGKEYVYKSVKLGGDQYDYEDEDPAIHAEFEAELAKTGTPCQMGAFHPYCTNKAAKR